MAAAADGLRVAASGYTQTVDGPVTVSAAEITWYVRNRLSNWALVQQGLGTGAMMNEIASATPGVVRVLEEVPPIHFPIWLLTHSALRSSRRIRVVFDALVPALS